MAAGRDEGRLAEVADVSESIATWAGDLTASSDCDDLVADTLDEFEGIDCVVNSAGLLLRGDALETSDEDWRAHIITRSPLISERLGQARVIAGTAYGATSPVELPSPTLYAELRMPAGSAIDLPLEPPGAEE